MKRIFRRREPGQPPRRAAASLFRGRGRGQRLPGYERMPSFRLPARLKRWPWKPAPAPAPAPATDATQQTNEVLAAPPPPSFKDRGQLRRRLRFLRRARELGFRDIGGLIFDMRRFERSRPDLLDAKLHALLAVDEELRALERILDDRRPFHELREPGISSCARCGALHSSEANFCPQCGMQFAGPRAMGEIGGAIAAPPQAPADPSATPVQAPPGAAPGHPEWPWPAPEPPADQPTAPTVQVTDPVTEQLTVPYVPVLQEDPPEPEPERPPPVADEDEDEATPEAGQSVEPVAEPEATPAPPREPEPEPEPEPKPAATKPAPKKRASPKPSPRKPDTTPAKPADPHADDGSADEPQTEIHLPPQASGGS